MKGGNMSEQLERDFAPGADVPADAEMRVCAQLCQEAVSVQQRIKQLDDETKRAKDKLSRLLNVDIPDAMLDSGMSGMTLEGGTVISVSEVIAARIPVKFRTDAFNWLRENGFGDLIKNEISVKLNTGDDVSAQQAEDYFQNAGMDYDRKEAVHHQTLNAFVKEQTKAGNPIPDDLFGVFRATQAKIK